MTLPITIRSATARERNLIVDNWQKSYLGQSRSRPHGTGPLAHMRRRDYFREQEALINAIFRHPGTEVYVAHQPDDADFVLGWVCGEPARRVLHFLYVSRGPGGMFRQQGIGTRLMAKLFGTEGEGPSGFPGAPIAATHWTPKLPNYRDRWRLQYNPYRLDEVFRG